MAPSKRKRIEYVPVDQLRFDSENPRLPKDDPDLDLTSQESILVYIHDNYTLKELGQSIADKGYFAEEPLQVVGEGGKFKVVEGNRRLATLKLILEPEARNALSKRNQETWEEFAGRAPLEDLREIPVIKHATRDELLDYLGFRHISGVKRWKAEAKARYLAEIMRKESLTFEAAAKRVGSYTQTVRRQAETYTVLEQATEAELDVEGPERYFGLFYNALQNPSIRTYVGLPATGDVTELSEAPIPPGNLRQLTNVLRWLFGEQGRGKILRDSREISKLGEALTNERATRLLEQGGDLDAAHHIAGGDKQSMLTALDEARLALLSANGLAFQWTNDADVRQAAQGVRVVMDQISTTLALERVG